MGILNDELRKMNAWLKAAEIPGYNSAYYRMDSYGKKIAYTEYGKRSDFGWEIDHIWPKSLSGNDSHENLRALHWHSNRQKSDAVPLGLLAALFSGLDQNR